MSLDDLLGLIFLLIFVVAPIVRGLIKPQQPEVVLTEVKPPPKRQAKPRSRAAPPQPESKGQRPAPRTKLVPPTATESNRQRAAPQTKLAAPTATMTHKAELEAPPQVSARKKRGLSLRVDHGGILEGILWHEILSPPRALRPWKPKR